MRSKATLAAIWLISTVVAVTVVWQSLSFVSTRTDSPEDSVAFPGLEETTVVGGTVGSVGPPVASGGPSPSDPAASGGQGGASSTSASASGTPSTTSTTTPSTTRATPKPASTPPGSVDQTFNVPGGQALVRFSPAGVTVVWATPADGYTVRVEPQEGGRTRIEFRRGDNRTRLLVWWDNGPRNALNPEHD